MPASSRAPPRRRLTLACHLLSVLWSEIEQVGMSIHVALHHRTTYNYDRPVTLGPQIVRLRPAPHARTPILSYALKIEPKDHFINWQQDPQGNHLARLVFPEKTRKFEVTVDLVADMAVTNPFDFFLEPEAETWPFAYDPSLAEEIAPFRKLEPPGPLLKAWLAKVDRSGKPRTVDFIVGLNARLQKEIGYIVRMEPGVQSCEQTLELAKGSCRDTGWLLVTILRHLGFAARFASGYLIQLTPDEKPLEGPEGPTHDFTDLHAWCEVYLPGAGWIGLDPTSGLLTGEGHIPLACTPEPSSAAPIEGAVEEAEVVFDYAMSVTRIRETPRTTRPYTDEQWSRLARRRRRHRARHRQGRPPPHHGRRAHLRVGRRHGRRGMEHARPGAGEAAAGGRAVPQARRSVRQRPTAAFRPGQMVSRRTAAALGAGLPLAQGRRADLARPPSHGAGIQTGRRHARDRPALCAGLRRAAAARSRLSLPGLRGHLVLPVARAPPAEQRRRRRRQDEGPAGARAPGPRVRAGAGESGRHRAADPAWAQRPRPLEERPVVPALGEVLPDPRRFGAGLSPAARFAAVGGAGRYRAPSSSPIRWSSIPPCRRSTPSAARRCWCGRIAGHRRTRPTAMARPRGARRGSARWRPISGRGPASARPPPAWCARPWPSSRATAISMSSCRRSSAPRIISTSWRRSRTPPRNSASRSSSKATARPAAIRGCCISASRPIPA